MNRVLSKFDNFQLYYMYFFHDLYLTITSLFQNLIARSFQTIVQAKIRCLTEWVVVTNDPVVHLSSGKFDQQFIHDFGQVSNDGYLRWKNGSEKCPRAPHTSWIEHVAAVHRASWLSTHRAHVAFTVNVRSAWQAGNERVGGGWWSLHAPVTATPVAIASRASPMQNHPLSRSR